tara:strand:- start:6099 stop:6500 length:402 start_codon:yes stop_codon:yes gene_type:complete
MATIDVKLAPPDEDIPRTIHQMLGVINDLVTAVKELIDDHATTVTELTAIGTTLADYKAIYDAHTHECPGSSFAASRSSTPDTGAAENSLTASAASAFTDTSGSPPATLTAGDPDDLTFTITGTGGTETVTPS